MKQTLPIRARSEEEKRVGGIGFLSSILGALFLPSRGGPRASRQDLVAKGSTTYDGLLAGERIVVAFKLSVARVRGHIEVLRRWDLGWRLVKVIWARIRCPTQQDTSKSWERTPTNGNNESAAGTNSMVDQKKGVQKPQQLTVAPPRCERCRLEEHRCAKQSSFRRTSRCERLCHKKREKREKSVMSCFPQEPLAIPTYR